MFERTKSILGMGGREKRYPNVDDDYEEPHRVEDPHTTPDSSRMSFGEFVTQNTLLILSMGLMVIIGIVLLAVYGGRYFMTAFANPWFQRALAGLAIASFGYFWGRSSMRNALENRDEFVAYNPDSGEVTRFLGEFRKAGEGKHPLFVPIKGFSLWGHRAEPYRIKDLSQELVTRYDRNPEDEVVIRLHPSVCGTASTNTGRKTVQLVAGLEPDPFGRESNVAATLPDIAARDMVTDLKDELQAVESELGKAEKENNMLRRQREDAIDEAQKTRQEIREEVNDVMEMVYPFARPGDGRRRQSADDGESKAEQARRELNNRANGTQ